MRAKRLRALIRVAAAAVAMLSLVGAGIVVAGVSLVGGASRTLGTSAGADIGALVADTRGVVASAGETVDALAALGADLEQGSRDTAAALREVGSLIESDVAGSLESVDRALPALVEAGQVIDTTLRTLALFGVDYDPPVPFDEALADVQSSIAGLPGQVRDQGSQLVELGPTVDDAADDTALVIDALEDMRRQLSNAHDSLQRLEEADAGLSAFADVGQAIQRWGTVLRVLAFMGGFGGVVLAAAMWRIADDLDALVSADRPVPVAVRP